MNNMLVPDNRYEINKILVKLEKTRNSIHAVPPSMTMRNRRAQELSDRYTDLRFKLMYSDNQEYIDAWVEYCNKHEYSIRHIGADFFT